MYNEQMTSINGHPLKMLTDEEFEKNKHDAKFVHEITWAHGVEGWDNYNLGMCYYVNGTEYYVSKEMQEKAKAEYNRRKKAIVNQIGNKLVFVGMGCEFEPSTPEYIGNHRIRTYFKNNNGILCFVEFGTAMDKNFLRCDHALLNTRKEDGSDNWKSLKERDEKEIRVSSVEKISGASQIKYTKENILKIVNEGFDCSFKEVEVEEHFVSTQDFTCVSKDEPASGEIYQLTGASNEKCLSNGYSWKESKVRRE